jgi:DNA gyrase subunit B
VTVEDNGRGIPVDTMDKNGKSALEVVLTVLHAGGKFDKATYQVSGGLHGVGVSVVNALSSWLIARVYRDGNRYEMRFERGLPMSPVQSREETVSELQFRYERWYGAKAPYEGPDKAGYLAAFGKKLTGTEITFMPVRTIFETVQFDYDVLVHRLRELAYLKRGIRSGSGRQERDTDSTITKAA